MHVPTHKELENSITEKVIDSFAELVFVADLDLMRCDLHSDLLMLLTGLIRIVMGL